MRGWRYARPTLHLLRRCLVALFVAPAHKVQVRERGQQSLIVNPLGRQAAPDAPMKPRRLMSRSAKFDLPIRKAYPPSQRSDRYIQGPSDCANI